MIFKHASDSIPEHSQSAISTTTVHAELESDPAHSGWSGGGGEGGGGEGGGDGGGEGGGGEGGGDGGGKGGGGEGGGGEGGGAGRLSCGQRQLHAR